VTPTEQNRELIRLTLGILATVGAEDLPPQQYGAWEMTLGHMLWLALSSEPAIQPIMVRFFKLNGRPMTSAELMIELNRILAGGFLLTMASLDPPAMPPPPEPPSGQETIQ
jgi:hypothetical protein